MPLNEYPRINKDDPLPNYYLPIVGTLYRRRVELCLAECQGGDKILEIGFGSGVSFLNLKDKYKEIHGIDLTADVNETQEIFARKGIATHLKNGNVTELPYPDATFDTVLSISILEHLKNPELVQACREITRVLKPGGQVVYGVPVERPFMVFMFRVLGDDIRKHHFSTHDDVSSAMGNNLQKIKVKEMRGLFFGSVYEVGHYTKAA